MAVSIGTPDADTLFLNTADIPPYTTALTVMLFLRFDADRAAEVVDRLVYALTDANPPTAATWVIRETDAAHKTLECFLLNGATSASASLLSTTDFDAGDWHWVTIVSSGTTHRFYIDSMQEGGDATLDLGSIGATVFELLGEIATGLGAYSVCRFRMWTAALGRSEIVMEMMSTVANRTADLYRDVALDTVDGTDLSGGGHDFTLVNDEDMSAVAGPHIAYGEGVLEPLAVEP